MKGLIRAIFLSSVLIAVPLLASMPEKSFKEKELCVFAEDVFRALRETQEKKRMEAYENSSDPIIQSLAEKFASSFKEGAPADELQVAISELGRLIKCSADEEYRMPYALNKADISAKTGQMEIALKDLLPQFPNYHKLMIESLADEKWDLALYAYLKIAEERAPN